MAPRHAGVSRGALSLSTQGAAKWPALLLSLMLAFQGELCQGRSDPEPPPRDRVFHAGAAGQSLYNFTELPTSTDDIDGRELITSYTCTSAPSGTCPVGRYTGCCSVSGASCTGFFLNTNCNSGLPCPDSQPIFSCCTDFSAYLFCPFGDSGPVCNSPASGTSPTCSGDTYGACCQPTLGTCAAGPYRNLVGSCLCPDAGPRGACCSDYVISTYYACQASAPLRAAPARAPPAPIVTSAPPVPTLAPPTPQTPRFPPPTPQSPSSSVLSSPPAPSTNPALPDSRDSGGSSMVPILAGVGGGVLVIAAVLGGVVFFMCKTRKAAPHTLPAAEPAKDAYAASDPGIPVAAVYYYPPNASNPPVGQAWRY